MQNWPRCERLAYERQRERENVLHDGRKSERSPSFFQIRHPQRFGTGDRCPFARLPIDIRWGRVFNVRDKVFGGIRGRDWLYPLEKDALHSSECWRDIVEQYLSI